MLVSTKINTPLIECVPNFSEGRDKKIIDQIKWSIESVPGVKVLHIDMGYDAHRTVITFVGNSESCKEAAYRSIRIAYQLIDMSNHTGAHPRIGAVDVFPFVPLHNTTMEDAIKCSHEVGQRIAAEFDIPVYLYGHAALSPDRKLLANVRKGEYEGLLQKLSTPEGKPDFGKAIFNPQTGALIIGARQILVAYNINLDTKNAQIAKKIAIKLREKNGGLKAVRAIGWYMPQFECAQVSTNLVDIDETPLHVTFETTKSLARDLGAHVTGSELVGLIPLKALIDASDFYTSDFQLTEKEKIANAVKYLGLNTVKKFEAAKQVIEYLI